MSRNYSIRTSIALALITIGASIVCAHEGMEHVMGTVSAVTANSITVDTVKHKSVTVIVDGSTTFSNKDNQMFLKDLKVGERVVIHAKEGKDEKLHAVIVKWGASSSAPMAHADHKM